MRSAFVATLLLFTCAGFAGKKDLRSPQKFRLERSYAIKNKSATEALAMRVFIPDVISYQNARVLQSEYSIQPMEKKTLPNGTEQLTFDLELAPAEATFKSLEFGEMHNAEIIVHRGLWTDTGTGWVSWSIPKKSDKIKEIKLLGHRWQNLD